MSSRRLIQIPFIILLMIASGIIAQEYLADSEFDLTGSSSTTPIYHLISFKGEKFHSLSRDEK